MRTTEQGKIAENAVAKLLKKRGFKIFGQNWRTRVCEIDLIVIKDKVVYFVEVKYRASSSQGDGFEYITSRKLEQMAFAAEIWIQENDWSGDYRLMAAAVSGEADEIRLIEL